MLDTVKSWIAGFAPDQTMAVDYLDTAPGAGLFPKGIQQIRRNVDILGNETVRCRCAFTLKRTVAGIRDKTQAARWMLQFQNWVRSCPDAPSLGEDTRWYAKNGKLEKITQAGTAVYTVELVGEFTEKTGGSL